MTEPCGMPQDRLAGLERMLLTDTICCLSVT